MMTFLSHFTPSMMPEDVIERIFVQRKRLASRLVTLVGESVLGTAKHHTLIVGPRGIGKTHLASLVYHRVRGLPELADRLRIAWLREEEWGIASFLDFVVRVLRALDEEYPQAGMAANIDNLFMHKPGQAEREAVALLDEFVGDRTVFLLAENLDQLFEGLDDVGQQQFRAYLQDRASWTILATAPGLFSGISLQSSPFYGFFRVRHLRELSVDEAIELLQKIAELSGRKDLASFVSTPVGRARIRAVHHLAGGNHRIYVIFSEFLTRETLDELVDPFLTTMDHLTPYYQARMQALSPQQRKIVEHLCEVRHAVPVKDIAQRCFISQQTASAQLKLLKERGFVRSFNAGRESHYELLEPLLRLSLDVKKQRGGPIRLFIDFLRFWYTKPELEQRLLTTAVITPVDREYFQRALQEWNDTIPISEVNLKEWHRKYKECIYNRDFGGALEYAESMVRTRGGIGDLLAKASCLGGLGEFEEASQIAQQAHTMAPEHPGAKLLLGLTKRDLGFYQEAVDILEEPAFGGEMPAVAWSARGTSLRMLGREAEALSAFAIAAELDPTNVVYFNDQILSLLRLNKSNEALRVVLDHPNASSDPTLLESQGTVLSAIGRYQDAAEAFRESLRIEETASKRGRLASTLIALDRLPEAEIELARAAELGADEPILWITRGFLEVSRGNLTAANNLLDQVGELAHTNPGLQSLKGLIFEHAGRPVDALEIYQGLIDAGTVDHAPYFRLPAVLAVVGQWDHSLEAFVEAMRRFGSLADDDGVGVSLLTSWLTFRAAEFWPEELAVITNAYAERALLPLLSTVIAKTQIAVPHGNVSPSSARKWVATWSTIAEAYPILTVGVRLLRAGTEYQLTGDPRHLLELASEERSMVESIPGIRPLSELS